MTDPVRPAVVLRLDGLAIALVAVVLYRELGQSWWLFALLFLVPDLSILGYLVDRKTGAVLYNAMHALVWPAGLFVAGFLAENAALMALALIWLAHVGIDRVLGLGLKYQDAPFRETHLQRV